MTNGLILNINEFEALPNNKKLTCLYQNQCTTMQLIRGYKLYYRITAIIGTALAAGVGILFKLYIGGL